MKVIKVYGPGCAKCKQTEEMVRKVVMEHHIDAEVVKITDIQVMLAAGVMMTPAVSVDDKIVCAGKVPSPNDVLSWIKE